MAKSNPLSAIKRAVVAQEQAAVSYGSNRQKSVARGSYKPRTLRAGGTGSLEKYVLDGFNSGPSGPSTMPSFPTTGGPGLRSKAKAQAPIKRRVKRK